MSLKEEFEELMKIHWKFLYSDWPIIERTKYHRSEVKNVKEIFHVKTVILNRLGVIPVFFFLIVLFGNRDYVGPCRNIEKGLLILYHLMKGLSLNEMNRFIPKSSFNDIYQDFYRRQLPVLNQRISFMLENMFSNIHMRIKSAMEFNPSTFKHVTLFLDGHDTRGTNINQDTASYYSYKLKKPGFRTQVVADVHKMVLFVSRSRPCADYNDGTMFVEMNIQKRMHKVDCLAVDGGYTLFIDQAIANTHLNDANFCYPIRKAKGVELTETETKYNDVFGSFRSKIESTFAEIGTTFERLNNCKYIKVSDLDIFTVQLKLACLLSNIKNFVDLGNIHIEAQHSSWLLDNFDYRYDDDITENEFKKNINVKTKLDHGEQMLKLQQQLIELHFGEQASTEDETMSTDETIYYVEKILDHRGEEHNIEYLVKWVGYGHKDNSWEPISSFEGTTAIDTYWRRIHRNKKIKRKQ